MVETQQNSTLQSDNIFCSNLSRELDEPMFGTAVHNAVWFLLEYDAAWGEKATSNNTLPSEVQAWLDRQVEARMGQGRVQFIKQERRRENDTLAFYIADAREMAPKMWRFRLREYQELLDIDVAGILASDGAYESYLHAEPLYLVCTNGRRDRCCALYGLELYYTLQAVAGNRVWRTTHVGGHRFAANVLTFPDGTYYGRMHTGDVEQFYTARERGDVAIDFLRGRSCYEKVVQAAEYHLRRETDVRRLHAFRLDGVWSPQADNYHVTFKAADGDSNYVVHVRREAMELPIYASCGQPRVEPVDVYQLVSVRK